MVDVHLGEGVVEGGLVRVVEEVAVGVRLRPLNRSAARSGRVAARGTDIATGEEAPRGQVQELDIAGHVRGDDRVRVPHTAQGVDDLRVGHQDALAVQVHLEALVEGAGEVELADPEQLPAELQGDLALLEQAHPVAVVAEGGLDGQRVVRRDRPLARRELPRAGAVDHEAHVAGLVEGDDHPRLADRERSIGDAEHPAEAHHRQPVGRADPDRHELADVDLERGELLEPVQRAERRGLAAGRQVQAADEPSAAVRVVVDLPRVRGRAGAGDDLGRGGRGEREASQDGGDGRPETTKHQQPLPPPKTQSLGTTNSPEKAACQGACSHPRGERRSPAARLRSPAGGPDRPPRGR